MLDEVGLSRAIVPRYPGVTSAMGCVIADMRADFVQTVNALTATADGTALAALIADHLAQGQSMLSATGGAFAARVVTVELDMAYVGQTHTVAVPLPVTINGDQVTPPTPQDIATAFEAAYLRVYGRLLPGGVSRILNLRTAVIGQRPKFDLSTLAPVTSGPVTPRTTRRVHMGGSWCDAAIYDRLALPVGSVVNGPAVLEQPDTTILIEPGLLGTVDAYGNVILTREGNP